MKPVLVCRLGDSHRLLADCNANPLLAAAAFQSLTSAAHPASSAVPSSVPVCSAARMPASVLPPAPFCSMVSASARLIGETDTFAPELDCTCCNRSTASAWSASAVRCTSVGLAATPGGA